MSTDTSRVRKPVHVRLAPFLLTVFVAMPVAAQQDPTGRGEAKQTLESVEKAIAAWDIPGARANLTRLEALVPADIEPLRYLRGLVNFEEGNYDEAVAQLESAGVADRPGSYLRLARDTQALTAKFESIESENFIFSYPPGKDAVLAPYALEALEGIRKALAEDLGYTPPGKVRVEVVGNAKELARVSTLTYEQIKTTGTIAICKFNKLMVTSPKAVLRGYDWLDTLSHEYVHLVVSQMSGNTVPIWLHEGMAKYLESRWRGKAGLAISPSTLALLGQRVKKNNLIPFEKMHPSMALLPSAEDAATAFAEVFFAIDYVHREKGPAGLRKIIEALKAGRSDKQAVEAALGASFASFEKSWLAHLRRQDYPKELLPMTEQKVELAEEKGREQKKGKKEISFGDFAEITEVPARKSAHLGELLRERNRLKAAAEQYAKAHARVGDKYDSLSNKYALSLLQLGQLDAAENVLESSLRVHPTVASTHVHLGRIHLFRKDWARARKAYLEALSANPFDPEIHFALLKVHRATGDSALAERTRKAAMVLSGLSAPEADQVADALARTEDTLVGPDTPAATEESGSAGAAEKSGAAEKPGAAK